MFNENELKQMDVLIKDPATGLQLEGLLTLPKNPLGFVLFAHGSGSSKTSPRNIEVANTLSDAGIATLLFDLLTPSESINRKNVFDIPLLSERLIMATRWLKMQSFFENKHIAYFGASTGGAAALLAGARLGTSIAGIVSRGGRPDLVPNHQLSMVLAPTLLIVGELDEYVLDWNRDSVELLSQGKLLVIPGASHLFEEEGALERVAYEAKQWFLRCFKEREHERLAHLQ